MLKRTHPIIKYWYKNKLQMETYIQRKQTIERQAAFSQAKWVTHIALKQDILSKLFSGNITHCRILRWSGVSGWSPAVSLTPWIMLCSTQTPPSTVWKHWKFIFLKLFCLNTFFQCGIDIQFCRKSRKRHMPQSVTLETNHSTEELWGWEAGTWLYACDNGTECVQGSAQSLLLYSVRWEIRQYVTNVLVTSFLNEQATVHGKQLQKHCIWVFLETTSFRHPLNVLHINQMWQTVFFCFMYIHIDIYVYMYISFVLYNIYIHSFSVNKVKSVSKNPKVTNVTKGIAGSHSILLLFIFWLLVVTFLKFHIYKKHNKACL